MRKQANIEKNLKSCEQPFSFSDSTNTSFTRITRNAKANLLSSVENSNENQENNEKDKNTNNRLRRMKKLIGCPPTDSEEKRLNGDVKKDNQICIEKKAKNDCCICLGDVNLEEGHLDCSHFFCFTCIKDWSNYTNTCPLCKQDYFQIKKKRNDLVLENFKIEPKVFMMDEEDDDDESDQSFDGTDENCYVCDNDNNHHLLLICDKCNFFICHTYCASPALDRIPESDWFCSFCSPTPSNNNSNNFNTNYQINQNNNNNIQVQASNILDKNKNARIMTRSSCVFGNFEYVELKNDFEMDIFAHHYLGNNDYQEENLDENSNKENYKFYNLRTLKRKREFADEEESDSQSKKRKTDIQYPLRSQKRNFIYE